MPEKHGINSLNKISNFDTFFFRIGREISHKHKYNVFMYYVSHSDVFSLLYFMTFDSLNEMVKNETFLQFDINICENGYHDYYYTVVKDDELISDDEISHFWEMEYDLDDDGNLKPKFTSLIETLKETNILTEKRRKKQMKKTSNDIIIGS